MSPSRKPNIFVRATIIASILVVLIALYSIYAPDAKSLASNAGQEQILNVVSLNPQDITISTSYVGYVTPIKSVDLVPNVSGYIDEVWVEGGQKVKTGDNLLMIDQREYKAALDAAKASVTQAQANLNNAKVYYDRIKKAGPKAISPTEFDNAKAKYLSALAAIEEAKANQAKAQTMYDYTVLQASIDGIVGNVNLTKGNYVAPASNPLISIIQYDPIRVVFSIPDKEYLDAVARHNGKPLFSGESIKLRLSNGNLYAPQGEFKFTDNAIDKATSSIAVYADFANPANELLANAYVDVLVERNIKGAYLVRQNHLNLTPQGPFVYTVKGSKLIKTPAQIVSEQNGNYVLTNSFAPDEYLVTDKIGNIAPNTKIKTKIAPTEKN